MTLLRSTCDLYNLHQAVPAASMNVSKQRQLGVYARLYLHSVTVQCVTHVYDTDAM